MERLCYQNLPNHIYESLEKNIRRPKARDVEELTKLILECMNEFPLVFLVFDALDECEDAAGKEALYRLIKTLRRDNVRIMITSRQPPPVDLGPLSTITIRARDSDIATYVGIELRDTRIKTSLKEEIVANIVSSAQGM